MISVRVDATHSELWSYEGAGIYRNVRELTRTARAYPAMGDVCHQRSGSAKEGSPCEGTDRSDEPKSGKSVDLIVQNSIIDCQGKEVNKSGTTLTLPSLETKEVETYMDVRQVDLWSLKTPMLLYVAY